MGYRASSGGFGLLELWNDSAFLFECSKDLNLVALDGKPLLARHLAQDFLQLGIGHFLHFVAGLADQVDVRLAAEVDFVVSMSVSKVGF